MAAWPFHAGEIEAQIRAGGGSRGGAIRPSMPDVHRAFFEALPFAVVASSDRGWPVATIWAGAPGFITAPDPRTLQIAVALDPADPATRAIRAGAPFGLLGIELATRRRNRANGVITSVDAGGVTIAIQQSFGNCPQYIWPREISAAAPGVASTEALVGLDPPAAAAIAGADTFFVASCARTDEPTGGVDVSHRGGPPGFVRVDGDVLTIPDFPGNRYFNTLGNLVSEPRAALLFVDFATGDVLHVQGATEIRWDRPETPARAEIERIPEHPAEPGALGPRRQRSADHDLRSGRGHDVFPAGTERLWRVHVERGWRRRGALALR